MFWTNFESTNNAVLSIAYDFFVPSMNLSSISRASVIRIIQIPNIQISNFSPVRIYPNLTYISRIIRITQCPYFLNVYLYLSVFYLYLSVFYNAVRISPLCPYFPHLDRISPDLGHTHFIFILRLMCIQQNQKMNLHKYRYPST